MKVESHVPNQAGAWSDNRAGDGYFERRKTAYQAFVEKRMAIWGPAGSMRSFKRRKTAYQAFGEIERGDPADPTGQWRRPFEVSTADDRYRACASVDEVAVGTIITDRPPHRSVRALISAYGSYLRMCGGETIKGPRMEHARCGKPVRCRLQTPSPGLAAELTTALERLPPVAKHAFPEQPKAIEISRHGVVVEVTLHN